MKPENKNPAHPFWVTLLCRATVLDRDVKNDVFLFVFFSFMPLMIPYITFFNVFWDSSKNALKCKKFVFPLPSASSRRIIPFNSLPAVKKPSPSTPSKLPVCGKRHKKRLAIAMGRILGGNSALPGTHPWMAAIYVGELDFCAGTLVSSCWIVSAAHCFFRKYDNCNSVFFSMFSLHLAPGAVIATFTVAAFL